MKYFRPDTLEEYFKHLSSTNGDRIRLLAGGTDLVPRFEQGAELPETLIDIKNIPQLREIRETKEHVEIGALTTIEEIHRSDLLQREFHALWLSARDFAGVQIRHRATIGGNICNASPAGDTLPPLHVFDAGLKLVGESGERTVPIGEFIIGPGQVDMKRGELLCSILLPRRSSASAFFKFGLREAMAVAVFNFAVGYRVGGNGFAELDIAAGAVAPTVVRLGGYASAVRNDPRMIAEAVNLVDRDISPIDDIRSSAKYRRNALKNVLQHTLTELLESENE